MSSLAMSAALIENDNQNIGQENTLISKKRQYNQHNKTQKKNTVNNEKINSVLETIHNSFNDESNSLGDFIRNDSNNEPRYNSQNANNNYDNSRNNNVKNDNARNDYMKKSQNIYKPLNPIDPPRMENMTTMNNTSSTNNGGMPIPMQDDNADLQNLDGAFMNDEQVNQYYRRLMTNTNNTPYTEKAKKYYENNKSTYAFSHDNPSHLSSDGHKQLIDKLNYMINLLEEQQDERTGNVTEEVVLYSFLGIFIIFIADSFVRVGKYVR